MTRLPDTSQQVADEGEEERVSRLLTGLSAMAILFLLNVGIMLLIGKLRPKAEPYVLEYTNQVEIAPYRYVKQVGLAVVVIVILIYIAFAK